MSTVIKENEVEKIEGGEIIKYKKNWKEFLGNVLQKFSDSTGDLVVTVAVTGITLAFMQLYVHALLFEIISGFYIAGMIVQLFIRIVHRFDEHYTVDELAQRLMELEYNTSEKLDCIIRNQ